MSLNSLAANRLARETTSPAPAAVRRSASEDSFGPTQEDVENSLSSLVEYVPTETVTMYLATLAAIPAIEGTFLDAPFTYWLFAALTPILFALIYAGKRRAAGLERWPGKADWPWWPMAAATIAFLVWGLTVPNGPYLDNESGRVVSGLLAVVVSTLLGVAGRFFATTPAE